MIRAAELEQEDLRGAPYRPLRRMDYDAALVIARSAHPSRVLTNSLGYRYGRFTEDRCGIVTVDMMGSRIAEFSPEGVKLSSCGWVTVSTTQALSELVTGGWFYARGRKIYFASYSLMRADREHVDGTVYPYSHRRLS
jgi:hypothetical protein